MPSIEEQLKNVRTMEDIVNLLSILFTNLNNQSEQYYDMFWNPVPMDLELEKYNENGELITVTHPNVAKMRISAYSGPGNPNGSQVANIGALYIDTNSADIYYKATGSDSYGWQLIWTTVNLRDGIEYLSPTGDGSQLHDLNASSVTSGTLGVPYGGTGVNGISGLIKGNGISPFSEAIIDEDYLAPSSLTGLIMSCPIEIIPQGWLICDGTIYDANYEYWSNLQRLRRKLGAKYGGDGINSFGVPNLIDKYVKYGSPESVGSIVDGHIGEHSHVISGVTASANQNHRHDCGDVNNGGIRIRGACGSFWLSPYGFDPHSVGQGDALYMSNPPWPYNVGYSGQNVGGGGGYGYVGLDAYNGHGMSGNTGWMSNTHEHSFSVTTPALNTGSNEVDHIIMIPIIKV